jgi:hypothetical protein
VRCAGASGRRSSALRQRCWLSGAQTARCFAAARTDPPQRSQPHPLVPSTPGHRRTARIAAASPTTHPPLPAPSRRSHPPQCEHSMAAPRGPSASARAGRARRLVGAVHDRRAHVADTRADGRPVGRYSLDAAAVAAGAASGRALRSAARRQAVRADGTRGRAERRHARVIARRVRAQRELLVAHPAGVADGCGRRGGGDRPHVHQLRRGVLRRLDQGTPHRPDALSLSLAAACADAGVCSCRMRARARAPVCLCVRGWVRRLRKRLAWPSGSLWGRRTYSRRCTRCVLRRPS